MALTDNLLAFWNFDDSSGNATDATGNGKTLTNNGSIPFSTSYGKINNGASLSGTQYFDNSSIFTTNADFSLSFWVNLSSTSLNGCFVHIGNPSSELGLGIGVGNTNFDTAGNNLIVLLDHITWMPSTHAIGTGWHHIVLTRSGNTYTYYEDNSQVFQQTQSGATSIAGTLRVNFDANTAPRQTSFYIDMLGPWSRAITTSEISTLYNSGAGMQYPFTVASTANPSFLLSMI